ncbi:MAG: BamA/TamA family outer membrane protein [Flavobacteriales bacterium]|nr:BamA/TamA family outer membrane protein [Flavobacteriales bacterium]
MRNDKNRLKYGITYYRRSMIQEDYYSYMAYITNLFKAHITYPLSPVSMVNVAFGIRRDVYRYLSTSEEYLAKETTHRDYITLSSSYTYDNSTFVDKNIRRGFRAKVFAEVYQGLYGNPLGQTMINLGFDARHYLRIHKNIIWANRAAFGTSVGNLKLLYYLGGVDNQFSPTFSDENPASTDYNWGFQTLATPMRGFPQNARYGSSFAVLNTELRIPLFQYLSRNTIRFAPLRHFQIVPFADMGAAWTSTTPWAADNEYNKKTLTQGDITIILNRSLDPFIFGYGAGVRTYFFGYFLRADWAWGHDSGLKVPMRFYFSMGFDF